VLVLDRRRFLGVCATALGSAGLSAEASLSAPLPAPYIYASESFVHRRNRPFVLGFLITARPEGHIRALREIKTRTKYTRRLMAYSSTDALRLGCARAMLQYFVEDPELRFVARIRTGDFGADASRSSQYSSLFEAAGLPRGSTLRIKRRRPALSYNRLRGDGEAEVKARVKDMDAKSLVKRADVIGRTANDGLIELSSLLTGALFGSESCGGKLGELHTTKSILVTRLRSLLKVANINQDKPPKWQLR